jgi:DTW domain-containing protein
VSQRRASHANRCTSCWINRAYCVCESIRPLDIKTNVSLVVHVRELKLTSNTAQFVQKLIPKQGEIFIRGRVHEVFDSVPILKREGRPLFLYPHEDSLELNEEFLIKHPGPYHLIVPDGNWHQARKVKKREPGFNDLTAVKLPSGIVGEYQLRKAPQPEWVSTYEAVAHALAVLEGTYVRDHMMEFFRHWVKTTMQARFVPNLPD